MVINRKFGKIGSDFMSFKIVRNDLTKMQVDVIVNTANPYPIYSTGTDSPVRSKSFVIVIGRVLHWQQNMVAKALHFR